MPASPKLTSILDAFERLLDIGKQVGERHGDPYGADETSWRELAVS